MAKRPTRAKAPAKKPVDAPVPTDHGSIDVSPRFKLVFNGVMLLTVGCFIIAVALTLGQMERIEHDFNALEWNGPAEYGQIMQIMRRRRKMLWLRVIGRITGFYKS